jgi:hypothetical protein
LLSWGKSILFSCFQFLLPRFDFCGTLQLPLIYAGIALRVSTPSPPDFPECWPEGIAAINANLIGGHVPNPAQGIQAALWAALKAHCPANIANHCWLSIASSLSASSPHPQQLPPSYQQVQWILSSRCGQGVSQF